MDIQQAITEGIIFKKGKDENAPSGDSKFRTKAKKTTYVKGTHKSGAAKMKAAYKVKRAARSKK